MKNLQKQFHNERDQKRQIFFYPWCVALLICMCGLVGAESSAQAQTIGVSWIKIKEKKFTFDGWIWWGMNDGQIKSNVHGDLDVKDAKGLCARMRMDFYGGAHIFLKTKHGGSHCPKNDKRLRYEIALIPYQDKSEGIVYKSNKINKIKVSIEKKTAKKGWKIIGSQTVKLSPFHDKVKITRKGFDFGGKTFLAGAPTKSGEVVWTWSEGKVTPRVMGRLHLNNVASACARLQIEYFTYDKELLTTKFGEKLCASTNTHYGRDVDFSPYGNGKIAYMTITIQTLRADGSWDSLGWETSRYVNVPIACQGTRKPCSRVVGS